MTSFGAFEPKKNIRMLIDSYLASGVRLPLVLVMGSGWGNEREAKLLNDQQVREAESSRRHTPVRRHLIRFEYVTRSMLVTLIRGARSVLFPSLYEGFGLPVLESMALGTPVLTSNTSSLPEVAGAAAVQVDPYDRAAISSAIRMLAEDDALCQELSVKGLAQASLFSPERYKERINDLYNKLL